MRDNERGKDRERNSINHLQNSTYNTAYLQARFLLSNE